jgi:hypothetical protein
MSGNVIPMRSWRPSLSGEFQPKRRPTEQMTTHATVLWADNPEFVLERLRDITGRKEWWR